MDQTPEEDVHNVENHSDSGRCVLASFDLSLPAVDNEGHNRTDEAEEHGNTVTFEVIESEDSTSNVVVCEFRADVENESENSNGNVNVFEVTADVEIVGETKNEDEDDSENRAVGTGNENENSKDDVCRASGIEYACEKRNDNINNNENIADVDYESENSKDDTCRAATIENESDKENVNTVDNEDRSDLENDRERRTVEQSSANRGEDTTTEENEDDKQTAADDQDTKSLEDTKKKARHWSKQEVQDLLVKAINFRAPVQDLKTILRFGVEVNAAIKNGLNPLHYAAYCDNHASVEILLNAGANVNATDDIGYTPLHLCARRGNYRTMEILIENGSMINFNELGAEIRNTDETNKLGFTTTEPINLAIQNAHPKCAKLLLENGARANNKYFMGYEICLTPLDEEECLELLLEYGADPNVFNRCGLSPLMKACKDHHIPAVRTLIKYGADINAICPPLFEQKSVLQFAIQSGNIVIVNILLQKGAIMSKQGEYNFSALHTAVIKGRSDICRVLLQYRADASERTSEGATPLMLACSTPELKERKEIVQLLIDCGADVNAFSQTYSFFDPYLSPLTEYMKNIENTEEFSIVELLVRHGAEVHFSSSGLDRELRRLRDPFSILPYCHSLENFPEIFDMLINLANKYCPLLIHANEKLSEEKKDSLLYLGTRPRELKHQVRVMLRQKLSPGLPDNVEKLPLPAILKSYILIK